MCAASRPQFYLEQKESHVLLLLFQGHYDAVASQKRVLHFDDGVDYPYS